MLAATCRLAEERHEPLGVLIELAGNMLELASQLRILAAPAVLMELADRQAILADAVPQVLQLQHGQVRHLCDPLFHSAGTFRRPERWHALPARTPARPARLRVGVGAPAMVSMPAPGVSLSRYRSWQPHPPEMLWGRGLQGCEASMTGGEPAFWCGTSARHRDPAERRLQEMAEALRQLGLQVRVQSVECGGFVLFACAAAGHNPGPGAWASILRCQLASALADVALGPITQHWLVSRLVREARRHDLFLPPAARPRAANLARQLVEPPHADAGYLPALDGDPRTSVQGPRAPGGSGSAGAPGGTGEMPPAGPVAGGRPARPANLLRWHGRLSRCLLETMPALPDPAAPHLRTLMLEGTIRFRVQEYVAALKRAVARAVAELGAERDEQRLFVPWRNLWLGPPPRIYEVHVFGEAGRGYRLADRWGMPAGARWAGEGLAAAASEGALVGQLLRLAPRRIVLHVGEDDPAQAAVRGAFTGRVYSCRGCPRCGRSGPGPPR